MTPVTGSPGCTWKPLTEASTLLPEWLGPGPGLAVSWIYGAKQSTHVFSLHFSLSHLCPSLSTTLFFKIQTFAFLLRMSHFLLSCVPELLLIAFMCYPIWALFFPPYVLNISANLLVSKYLKYIISFTKSNKEPLPLLILQDIIKWSHLKKYV